MNKLFSAIPAASIALILAVSNVSAAVVNPSYPVNPIDPPPSVEAGMVENNQLINVFTERTNVVLPTNIAVDFTAAGKYDDWNKIPATSPKINAGTSVNSYYIFTDQVGVTGSKTYTATITFDEPIIGVMVNRPKLANSDAFLGAAGTTYSPTNGGLEIGGCGSWTGLDCVTLASPSTVSIKFTTWNITDSIRVITQGSTPVTIDIKPGSEPNCVNNNDQGVIPVAVLGSATFDAAQIDPATVQLEGMAVKVAGKGVLADIEDVNGDGHPDLVVKIQDGDRNFSTGSTIATITGTMINGTPFHGSDSICIVP